MDQKLRSMAYTLPLGICVLVAYALTTVKGQDANQTVAASERLISSNLKLTKVILKEDTACQLHPSAQKFPQIVQTGCAIFFL